MLAAVPPAAGPEVGLTEETVSAGAPTPTTPNLALLNSENQSWLPSGVIPYGLASAVGMRNWVIVPPVVMRPILLLSNSANHTLPSGPPTTWKTRPGSGRGNSVMTPAVVTRPIEFPEFSANQRLPSAPAVIPSG